MNRFVTIIDFRKEDLETVKKVCEEIGERDESFKFEIEELEDSYRLKIFSEDGDSAYKRGMWFVNKVECLKGIAFWVEEWEDI